jgi:hypothetical protein
MNPPKAVLMAASVIAWAEKNGSPSINRTILKKHRTIIGRFAWVSSRLLGQVFF